MSARFTKLEVVDLTTEEDVDESDHVTPVRTKTGPRRKKCGCLGSLKWVMVAVTVFFIAIVISLLVAELTREPPPQQQIDSNNTTNATNSTVT